MLAAGGVLYVLVDRPVPEPPIIPVEVVARYVHDPDAFTQGLAWHQGRLYESTGRKGSSTVRCVDPDNGAVLELRRLPDELFGEGLAVVGDRIYQLTWKAGTCLVWDRTTLERVGRHSYEGEGWGLAWDGTHLVMSDGGSELRFVDPDGFRVVRRLKVTSAGRPLRDLNELEWIRGEIWANIWRPDKRGDHIARIDPATGAVVAYVDCSALLPGRKRGTFERILNGVAYDPGEGRILVTGKNWPWMYEVRLPRSPR